MGEKKRGWPVIGMGLAWLLAMACHLQSRTLWPGWVGVAALLCGVLACLLAWRWRWRRWRGLALIGAFLLGTGVSNWRAVERMAQVLPPALEGQDVEVVGVVASLPQLSDTGVRFLFEVEQATRQGDAVTLPPRVALGWYVGWGVESGLSQAQRGVTAGQRWRFTVRLRQPHGNMNPHAFDYELYLFEQGVRASGQVRGDGQRLADGAGALIDRWRQRVRSAIEAAVSDPRAAGVLAALAVGDQSAIEREDWELFRTTGVAHLMSISGLHITMFAWLASGVLAWGWRRSRRAMLWRPAPIAAAWGGLALATAYALFSGWGVPAQRTVLMLAVVVALQGLGRRWPWPWVLVSAAVVVSAFDPWALRQAGFWLSFTAVALLMASEPAGRHGEPAGTRGVASRIAGALRGGVRTQVIATVGLAPLTLIFFQQVSVVGFVANLLAIPLVTLVITPLALLGVAWAPLWQLGALLESWLAHGLAWLAGWPGAVWIAPVAPAWAQLAGLVAAALVVLPLPWRMRLLAWPLIVPLLFPARAIPGPGEFELVAVDVGQGTAVLVRTQNHLLVYDTGPQYARDSDAGQRVLVPLLRARGETRVDRLVLSHRDTDHVGGAAALMSALPVTDLLSSLEPGHPLRRMAPSARRCEEGQRWDWDGVAFEVLHPAADHFEREMRPNALSCVLKVSAAQGSALLAGDVERLQEAMLVARHAERLPSDLLLVPHHGSRTSSTAPFLEAVSPSVAVVQAGYRNRFGHPVAEVMERLHARGTAVYTSAGCGAWTWHAATPAQSGICERDRSLRYWHRKAGAGDVSQSGSP